MSNTEEREAFEQWYKCYMPTACDIKTLREGPGYKDSEGDRLNIAWECWQHQAQRIEELEAQLRQRDKELFVLASDVLFGCGHINFALQDKADRICNRFTDAGKVIEPTPPYPED